VNDLLDLAKVEAGGIRLELAELDLLGEAEVAVRALAPEAAAAGVTVSLDRARVVLRADRRALRQMLLNLLSNAIKFTPAGGSISVAFERGPQGVTIAVADDGVGVAPEELARLLEPYAQGSAGRLLGQKGTGLGLSITRGLMELHGGRIELESAPGAGLTARLLFPPPDSVAERLAA
jgi:signal transduction histidine kinase